jgi:hypothetical protein
VGKEEYQRALFRDYRYSKAKSVLVLFKNFAFLQDLSEGFMTTS